MTKFLVGSLIGGFLIAAGAMAGEGAAPPKSPAPVAASSPAKYTLRYQFRPGETLRWKVIDETQVETTISGTTQVAEAHTVSTTAWRVDRVDPDGTATFQHSVESVDMRQKVSGRMETSYNSQTDKTAPPLFEAVARTIRVPLAWIVLDAQGKVQKTVPLAGQPTSEARVTVPLPERPVAVKESWSIPFDFEVTLRGGEVTKVKTLQRYTLESVQSGVATIRVEPQILTPMNDPVLEAQVVQREATGVVRFDIQAGRILGRTMEVDKRVVGFAGNGASVLGYRTHYNVELLGRTRRRRRATDGPVDPNPIGKAGSDSGVGIGGSFVDTALWHSSCPGGATVNSQRRKPLGRGRGQAAQPRRGDGAFGRPARTSGSPASRVIRHPQATRRPPAAAPPGLPGTA